MPSQQNRPHGARPTRHAKSAGARLPATLQQVSRAASLLLLLLVCVESSQAIPVSTYRERVRRAIITLGSIGTSLQGQSVDNRQRGAAAISEVRSSLTSGETVEWQGAVVRVDNGWLKEALDDYESLPPNDAQRPVRLARIVERLQSLDQRLTAIEGAEGKQLDKEEEKARLAAILRRDEYKTTAAEGNALTRLINRIMEWLRRLFPRRDPTAGAARESRAVSNLAQIIVTLLSLAVIAYVGWKFLPRFLRRDMKKSKRGSGKARVVLGEHLSEDQTSADLLAEAEALARTGDVRAAIRKGYIALLCELHDRKLVRLAQHKTNRDYLRAVEANRALHDEMKPMTASFENHWYGLTPAAESDWQSFRSRYHKAVKEG